MASYRASATAAIIMGLVLFVSCGDKRTSSRGGNGNGGGFEFKDPERIVVEIESGNVGGPFKLADDAECSGGKCVVLEEGELDAERHPTFRLASDAAKLVSLKGLDKNPLGKPLVPNGMIEIPFTVKKAATYDLWVRAWFNSSCANSFFLSMDAPPPVDTDGDGKWDENDPYIFSDSTEKRWKWVERKGVKFDLAAGPHVIRIFNREDGIKLDQVFMLEVVGGAVAREIPMGRMKAAR